MFSAIYSFIVFSLSKNFQKPKNVGQLKIFKSWVDILLFFLLIGISSKQTNYLFLILAFLLKISVLGCFVTANSFNKQNSHTVTLNIKRLFASHSQPYDFPSLTMLVSILSLNNILNHCHISLTNKVIQLALLIFFRNKGSSDYQNEEKSTRKIYKQDNDRFSSRLFQARNDLTILTIKMVSSSINHNLFHDKFK